MFSDGIAPHGEGIYVFRTERSGKTILFACALLALFFSSGQCTIKNNVDPKNGVIVSLQAALEGVDNAQAFARGLLDNVITEIRDQTAGRDCLQLFDDTTRRLNDSLNAMIGKFKFEQQATAVDVQTWIGAALTNQHTCLNGFHDINKINNYYNNNNISSIGLLMSLQIMNVSNVIRNSLALIRNLTISAPAGNRRLLYSYEKDFPFPERSSGEQRRRLLQSHAADVVVAQDGSGDYKTITEALLAFNPLKRNETYYVIYIKSGIYGENIEITSNMMNFLMFGDGMDKTVVTSNRSVTEHISLFTSATFAVWGNGFVAKDITFANTAGPEKFQAVALAVLADMAVFYRCGIEGYQDTLLVHSNRQFFRDCHIYGTTDFIFGNSAVVIQNSNILLRRPLTGGANTITAQGRTDLDQNSGISIHACKIMAAPDLEPVQGFVKTYLGRPWEKYSRTVFMQSTLGDLIDPAGWLEWNATGFGLDTLYYGEFMNDGAGADTSKRVKWPGYHVITEVTEAQQFSVGSFIDGDSWIPSSGVPFNSGLS